jgi:hypothetical protein
VCSTSGVDPVEKITNLASSRNRGYDMFGWKLEPITSEINTYRATAKQTCSFRARSIVFQREPFAYTS